MVMALERPISRRSAEELARQKKQIAVFLRSEIDSEHAEAMASPGYRWFRCGGCGVRDCEYCDVEARTSARAGRASSRYIQDARYVQEVVARLSLWPRYLYIGVPRELARLPPDERLVVLLLYGGGLGVECVAKRLKLSRWTVNRLADSGLNRACRGIWNADGAVQFGGEN